MSDKMRKCFGPKTITVDVKALGDLTPPVQTDSYMPLNHGDFLDMVMGKLNERKIEVVDAIHALWRGGQRYFGLLEVKHPDIVSPDMSLVIAVRNSFDKSLPAAIAAGNSVFVCDNLVLSSEVVVGRKHTKNMFENLSDRIDLALKVLDVHWGDHFRRIESYKVYDLADSQANDLIVQAYRDGAIEKVGIADVVDQWYVPNHPEFKPRNAWSFHNAFTEVFKGRADLLTERSKALHAMLDKVVGFLPTDLKQVFAEDAQFAGAAGKKAHGSIFG